MYSFCIVTRCMTCRMNTCGNTYDISIAHTCMQYMYAVRYVYIPHFVHICIPSRMYLFVHPLPKNDMLHFVTECTSFSVCCIDRVTARFGNAGVTNVTSNLSPRTIISNAKHTHIHTYIHTYTHTYTHPYNHSKRHITTTRNHLFKLSFH